MFKKNFVYLVSVIILAIFCLAICSCNKQLDDSLLTDVDEFDNQESGESTSASMDESDNEEFVDYPSVSADETDYSRYLNKIWANRDENMWDLKDLYSFYFTTIKDGIVIGKLKTSGGLSAMRCYSMDNLRGYESIMDVVGRIDNGVAVCKLTMGNSYLGSMIIKFGEDELEVRSDFFDTSAPFPANSIHYYRAYNIDDFYFGKYQVLKEFELERWGNVNLVSARDEENDNALEFYLTNKEGYVLCRLYTFYFTIYDDAEIISVDIEDINGDRLTDIRIVFELGSTFQKYSEDEKGIHYYGEKYSKSKWEYLQMNTGHFLAIEEWMV